ncbi:MAG: selenide, water dikinase SelD [Cyanobacteria bacterium J083]|nr:MAG: selenide, water dikinase SelD [Cyanobacteria bacterium J083]
MKELTNQLIVKDLVLVGGGHSHAIALRLWGMNPLPGIRLTLISDVSHTPYSGMLPGHVAGYYSYDETHIDLRRLASFAQAQFYCDRVIGLDLKQNQLICTNHPPVAFDYASFDIGSTPCIDDIPGAKEYAIPAKPVPEFLAVWNDILAKTAENSEHSLSLAIVGGGAGGVELALNMHQRLQSLLITPEKLKIHLLQRGNTLLPQHNSWVRNRLRSILRRRGIQLHLASEVVEVLPDKVICQSGLAVATDYVFWVTHASAPGWLAASGIATDERGFILVEDTLQSVSHPHIFAAGDIATMKNYQLPKAGVFAVRQGKPLFKNLQAFAQNKSLKPYIPQKRYLALIGTGDKRAIASWSIFGWESAWLWQWKDRIDRQFMAQFENLPVIQPSSQEKITPQKSPSAPLRCAGCGSKVGSSILSRVLQRLEVPTHADVIIGLDSPDDAAIIQIPQNKLLVQTLDYFPTLINDPYIFGQIVTHHCLSDLFAMGATPHTALALATIPPATNSKTEETLWQLLSGSLQVLSEQQATLIGGHTIEGEQLAFGLNCNGLVTPATLLTKAGVQPGDVLILTKPLGIGTLFAAAMQFKAKGYWLDEAIATMLQSNYPAAQILLKQGATACTDVSGFGLLGHLVEMIKASQVSIKLNLATIPILPGAKQTIQQQIFSSLYPKNLAAASYIQNNESVANLVLYPILFDPQTSGGLLFSINSAQGQQCLHALRQAGYPYSEIIGYAVATELNSCNISLESNC